MRAKFAPQVQLDLQSSWSEYKDLSLGFAACLSKNPINEFLFLTFAAKEILTKVVYLFNRIANSYTHSSRIANPAEPRRVSGNSMGVLKITP